MDFSNSRMEVDANLANQLFVEGAVLIIAGVPPGTEFGIDMCSYRIGKDFRGVKMIPPGLHFVWCASQSPYGDSAPRVGFVHFFMRTEILVREWDRENEELRERRTADPALEKQRIREHLQDLDRFLAPYDYGYFGDWKNLTNTISADTMARCQPAAGAIRTQVEFQSCPDSERPRGVPKGINPTTPNKLLTDENDLLPNLKPIEGTAPSFTDVPDRIPKNATPAEISRHCMDCGEACEVLMESFANSDAFIEEIQIAYIFFLAGHSVESLAHWRKILNLFANSESAVDKYKHFYMKYSEVLAYQLPHLPEELMEPSPHNTVYKDIRSLLVNMSLCGLAVSADRLSKKLLRKMDWRFNGLLDDDPEDMPVIVETA